MHSEGERWAELIEAERSVPMELWEELRDRGYLRLAAPRAYGGRGIPFTRYLELLELFSMSHASLRMIVHVCNGIWRPMDSHASEEQRQRFVVPQVQGEIKVAFTLTEPTAGTGADMRSSVVREGDTYFLSGREAPDHLRDGRRLPAAASPASRDARRRGHGRADGAARTAPASRPTSCPRRWVCAAPTTRHLVFDRAPVPVADRLGEEGQGLEIALSRLSGAVADRGRE